MKTIGILGGGQLGLMLANSIYTLGGQAIVYDPDPDAPACRHTNHSINGAWDDYDLIKSFVESCDIITYEFENVEVDPLKPIAEINPIYPSLDVLAITQNRIKEKRFLKSANLPHARFEVVSSIEDLEKTGSNFPKPYVLKTARGGYDGKGQFLIKTDEDFKEAIQEFKKRPSFTATLEEFLTVEIEVSCIVARQLNGQSKSFPIFENAHKNHILDKTIVPARLPDAVLNKVKELATETTLKLEARGLLTTEFFITKSQGSSESGLVCGDYRIYINELAPRPHNSGHITRNACHMSQFDALARILMNMPLTNLEFNSNNSYCMVNILGDKFISQDLTGNHPDLNLASLKDHPDIVEVVLYGKKEARPGRKMGHFVCVGESADDLIEKANAFDMALEAI